jgi:hypothetical protein
MTLIGLVALAPAPARAAYDGPGQLVYDQTQNGIRVVMTTQAKVLRGGYSRFTIAAHVPIEAGSVGQNVVLQIRKFTTDQVIGTCQFKPVAGDVGTTVVYDCGDLFEIIPGILVTDTSVDVYPYVIRNGALLEHIGSDNKVTIPVVGDDTFEPNNTGLVATALTVGLGSPANLTDLVSKDAPDVFKFVAPPGAASAEVLVEFWNSANDIDVWIRSANGDDITGGVGNTDQERVIFDVTPGETYYIWIEGAFEYNPTFYDLQVSVGGAHTLDVITPPNGTPDPVSSGGVVSLNFAATDSLGHALSYEWTQNCIGLPLPWGTFSNRNIANPTWTAPINLTGAQKSCSIRISYSDGFGLSGLWAYSQEVDPAPHTLTITAGPSGAPNPVLPAGAVTLSVTASDNYGHALVYAWQASCPGLAGNGAFAPSAAVQTPTWTAPDNATGSQQACTVSVTVSDGQGFSANGSFAQNVDVPPVTNYTYYFAEGATIGGFFETRLALLNLDATATATVTIDFQLKDTTTVLTYLLQLPAQQRATIDVSTLGTVNPALAALASAEFSTVVRSDVPLVADRTMTWDATSYGSHAETAIDAPASTWYLAEGATIGTFELYYLIQNPNAVPLTDEIEVTYLLPPPQAPLVRTYSMGANTRRNIVVHAEPGLENAEVSAIIRTPADKPVIVERAMYLTAGGYFYGAGHESAGIRTPATQWFFAEGATGEFFDLFILIGNPNAVGVQVTATFLFDDGTTCSTRVGSGYENGELVVGARSRYNIWVDATTVPGCPRSLANAAVSTTITTNLPVVAERTMWWPGPTGANWAEAHNAPGATTTGTLWALADGEQGGARNHDTYVLVANTAAYDGIARVTLYFEDGATRQQDLLLKANSRTTVAVGAVFGAAVQNERFGVTVESLPTPGQAGPAPIVVERAMYSNGPGAPFWAAGTDVLATRLR